MVLCIETLREKSILEEHILEVDYSIVKEITDIEKYDGAIHLSGWILKPNSSNFNVKVILEETDGTSAIIGSTRTKQKLPEGIDLKFHGEIGGCSFFSEIDEKIIEKNRSYEILLYVTFEDNEVEYSKKISTGRYVYNEKIYVYNPETVSFPVFKDEYMKEVVESGKLYFFSEAKKIWIYVHENIVHWIMDEEYEFDETESTHIPYHIWTYEVDDLPSDRQQYGYDSRDFIYEKNELNVQDEGYKVACQKLPEDFQPTYIITGEYSAEKEMWVWEGNFQICFE